MSAPELTYHRAWVNGEVEYRNLRLTLDGRSMVIIDPADAREVGRLLDLYANACRGYGDALPSRDLDPLIDALQGFAGQALPRISEPGRFGVVEASCVHSHGRRHWVKGGNGNWYPVDNDETSPDDWDSLIDPVLVRAGVAP